MQRQSNSLPHRTALPMFSLNSLFFVLFYLLNCICSLLLQLEKCSPREVRVAFFPEKASCDSHATSHPINF